jgi:hypothetical protein
MRPTKAPIHKIIENIAMGGFTDSPTEICCYDRKYMLRELEHGWPLHIFSIGRDETLVCHFPPSPVAYDFACQVWNVLLTSRICRSTAGR